jgi:hypothetical protein
MDLVAIHRGEKPRLAPRDAALSVVSAQRSATHTTRNPISNRFVCDSALEGDGFELSVPGRAVRPFGRGEDVFQ